MNGFNKGIAVCLLTLGSLPLYAAPNTEGTWSGVNDWPMIPIHAVLKPDGKIFTWGTDPDGNNSMVFNYDVWNPNAGTGSNSHQTLPNTFGVDSFCSAGIVLPNGTLLMTGGDARPQGVKNGGIKNVISYSPNGVLSSASSMSFARWYPTTITLSNGEIMTVGGKDLSKRNVPTPEIYTPWTNSWRSLFGATTSDYSFYYPRLWVMTDGRVFGLANTPTGPRMFFINAQNSGSVWDVGAFPLDIAKFSQTTAVMYRQGKILVVADRGGNTPVRVFNIDVTSGSPVVREIAAPNQSTGRVWADTVLMPDGKVMLVGGSGVRNKMDNVSYRPEIWDPSTERWTTMSAHVRARLYHSTALLMQDGRVFVGGGGSPGPQKNTNAEIFSPPYLYNNGGAAPRPRITSAPDRADYGAWISVSSSSSNPISRVTLLKTGAGTHSTNMEQRFIELNFGDRAGGVNVGLPSSSTIATPGYYMIFLIDNKGVPSKGHMINLGGPAVVTNEALVARPDWVNASGSRITIDPLSNDGGSGLRLVAPNAYSLQGGKVALSNNKLTYKAKSGFNGTDKIWYSVRDSQGGEAWGEITITVSGNAAANPYPAGQADSTSATAGVAKTIDVLANDVGNGLVLAAPNAWSLQGGNVALVNNKLRYTAKSTYNGQDKIWYTFKDVEGRQGWGEVTINVSGGVVSNPYPAGQADFVSATAGAAKTIDVLANDVGNGLVLVAPNAWSLQGGNVALVNNKLRYTAKSSYNGQDKIWYTFRDVQGRQGWGEVTMTVSGGVASNPYPEGKPDWFNATSGVQTSLNVLANDVGNGLAMSPLSSAFSLQGGYVWLSNNAISYQSKSGFRGEDKIWYSFKDVEGRGGWGEVTVNVQ